jgi:peroxiredoxin
VLGYIGTALTWAAIGLGGWAGYQLMTQNGRLLLRVEDLERRIAELEDALADDVDQPKSLASGTVVPDFELPDLDGQMHTLSEWKGSSRLLIFFDPGCGYCEAMVPELATLSAEPNDGRPRPIVVTTASVAANRRLIERHSVTLPFLRQESDELARMYRVTATPSAYLIDADGVTVGELAVGAEAIMALARGETAGVSDSPKATVRRMDGSLANSRIVRDGLPAGSPAPDFEIQGLDGSPLRLRDHLGQRTLVVFSDPECGPCQDVASKLEHIHQAHPRLEMLMVSRGDPELNREKAQDAGLTIPIGLQQRWEISKAYGIFATPVAFHIDSNGIIAESVAVGSDQVERLARTAGLESDSG